jgi:hypothetical protein
MVKERECEEVGRYTGKKCCGDCGESLYEDAQMAIIKAMDWKPLDTDSDCFHPMMDMVYNGKTVKVSMDIERNSIIFMEL